MNKKHNHGVTSNTTDCFSTFIGCSVKGVINHRSEHTLVFECGWGLTFSGEHGSYWVDSPEEVQRKLWHARRSYEANTKELRGLLKLAGEEP